jgi:glycosyltransferase involved in cell wall biosynthesis
LPRFLIDVSRLLYRRVTGTLPTGIDRVGLEYVKRYRNTARAVLSRGPFSVVLSEADSQAIFRAVGDPSTPARLLTSKVLAKALLWRWMAPGREGDILFNTGHYGLESTAYAWSLRRGGARVVTVVHDLIPITHRELCRESEFDSHVTRMRTAATVSDTVIANSQHTLDVFRAFCEGQRLPVPRAGVAFPGNGLDALEPGARPMAEPYFIVLGTLEPRKNHRMLLQLWRRLRETLGSAAPRLVVIGQRGWKCDEVIDLLHNEPWVLYRAHCTDAELATWLHHAQALLFPSMAEGYGLPVTEALARGVPVIASDLPAFRETVGDIPDYADPLDSARWEALVTDYAQPGSKLRAAQLARLGTWRPFTWAEHFESVDQLLAQSQRDGDARS